MIELAPRDRLMRVEHLAPRFFREVLDARYEECLVTDESDLEHFVVAKSSSEHAVSATLSRMENHYFLGYPTAESSRIVDILEFLASHGITS
jgi:hypothetical protein